MKIKVYEDGYRDSFFYAMIGPFALDRRVTEEMHDLQYGSIYDEDYATWFIATDEDTGELIGFAALFEKPKPDEIFLDHCYIVPKHRGKGYGKELFTYRMKHAESIQGKRKIKAITKNEVQYHIYLQHGMRLSSKRGKYYWCVKEALA